jgi:rubredoxin
MKLEVNGGRSVRDRLARLDHASLRHQRSEKTRGWGCSDCGWVFNGAGPPRGDSRREMAENFERLRDKEFALHVCAKYPKPKK